MSKRSIRIGLVILTVCLLGFAWWYLLRRPAVVHASWDERSELSKFEGQFASAGQPSMRVIVQLDGVVGKPGEALTAPDDPAERAQRRQAIAKAQSTFLSKVVPLSQRSARRYPTIPFLSLDLEAVDVLQLTQWITTVPVTPDGERTFRVRVEEDRTFSPQALRSPARAPTTLDQVLVRIGWPDVVHSGEGPVVAVLDDRVTESVTVLGAEVAVAELEGRIVGRKAYARGYPNSANEEPTFALGNTLNHGTRVAYVIAESEPWCSILALRCDEADGKVWSTNVTAALVDIDVKWKAQFGDRLAVVSMSLGNNECFSDTDCVCWPVTGAAMTAALVNLNARGVVVVLPAGNKGSYVPGVVFPACFGSAITVGATYADSPAVAGTSCWSGQLDLCAPGHGIQVQPNGLPPMTLTGTSFAVPFVASAVALLRANHPTTDLQTILQALQSNGVPVTPAVTPRHAEPATIPEIRVAAADLSLSS